MRTPDHQHILLFNGELYNFRDLRRELEQKEIRFRSHSDTEVALQALRVWGRSALTRFNGIFALAYYDVAQHSLLLARDPLGVKPLYYLADPRGLVFGSQYDQIISHPFAARSEVHAEMLGLFLRLGFLPAPYGLLSKTFQLEPGHVLEIVPGGEPKTSAYFHSPFWPPNEASRAVSVDEIEATLKTAVSRQLVSDVPIGTFLSGGIDSPLVTALAQQSSDRPLPMFTVGSNDPYLDESDTARRYARFLCGDHHVESCTSADVVNLVDHWIHAFGEPFADHSALPTMLVSSIARQRVKVALSGDGGDEVFWGYPRFMKVLGASRFFSYPRLIRVMVYALGRVGGKARVPRGVLFPDVGSWYLDAHSALKTDELHKLCPEAACLPADFTAFSWPNEEKDPNALAYWLRWNETQVHLQQMLLKVDRASMYYGLEVRVPLLDLDVLRLAAELDPKQCIVGSVGKVLLRQTLARYIPPSATPVAKKGFTVPVESWLRNDLKPMVEDLLLASELHPPNLFDRRQVRRLYDEHLEGLPGRGRKIWTLLSLQAWFRRHLVRS